LLEFPLGSLLTIVALLVLLGAFFSSTETALMSVNPHRLRHQAQLGSRSARLTERLLADPDRLIGIILLGNTLVNLAAASLTSIIAYHLAGPAGVLLATGVLAVVILVFGEVAPKTLGALYPERLAFAAVWIYVGLVWVLSPLLWAANALANGALRVLGIAHDQRAANAVSASELRSVVAQASNVFPRRHQRMLSSILDLERITVDDIMIPRSEIASIDISDDWDNILDVLRATPHTRLPACEGNLDEIVGILHMKKIAHALAHQDLTRERLIELARAREAYFVPAGTTLNVQLVNFQRDRRRIALVVDEYGDIQGLVTLEDILEEIVGEFTSDPLALHQDVYSDPDGSFVVNGGANVRSLNRRMGWHLRTDGPRTLNGLIIEHLEAIPSPGTTLKLGDLCIEILQISDNAVKTTRVRLLPDDADSSSGDTANER
jgi:Mg2+/Co2+ transporter CorB